MTDRNAARVSAAAILMALSLVAVPAAAQQKPAVPARDRAPLPGMATNSKDPIKIDADRLEVFDKDNRAVFIGNVVAIQGESTLKATTLTVFYERNSTQGSSQQASAGQPGAQQGGTSIRRLEAKGPVTVISKDQVATGDNGVFDRVANVVTLTGNVALSNGGNVTKGDKLTYDLNRGEAKVETTPGGRVKGLFVPGSVNDGAAAPKPPKPNPAPRTN